jgi:hypothetical protein
MVKQTVRRLNVVIILKDFNKRRPHCMINRTGDVIQSYIELPSYNHWCHGKAVSITYSGCVFVALVTQNAMRMRRIISSTVASPAQQYLSRIIS